MVTIKRRVEMNLPHFIAWAVDNHITGSFYANDRVNAKMIRFEFGRIVSSHGELRSHDTFTVEVDEPITENTVFELMIEITDSCPNCLWEEASVEDWKDEDSKEFHAYIDGKFKLIWTKEEGLVE